MSKLCRWTFLLAPVIFCHAVNSVQSRSPLENLPPNVEILTHWGERAVWSPDGKRVAFVHRTLGDAFEIEIETREISCLTCTFEHAGFFRVHYLRSGDFILIGPVEKIDRSSARWNLSELWFLRRDLAQPPLRLNQKLNEGIAVSRQQSMIAWSESSNQYPETIPEGVSRLIVADVVITPLGATLERRRQIYQDQWPSCWLEAQDFRDNDRELIFSCYQAENESEVMGVVMETGEVTNYTKSPQVYDEPEGIFPGGEFTTVECDRQNDRGDRHIDIWKLRLDGLGGDYTRLTYFSDYEGYKASNPTISPDGLTMAFQVAKSRDEAGVGYGILLLKFAAGETRE